MTGKLEFGECLSPDADKLPSEVYLSPVETPPISNDGYFMFGRNREKSEGVVWKNLP